MNLYIIIPVFSNLNLTTEFLNSIDLDIITRLIIVDDNPRKLHKELEKIEKIDLVYGDGNNYWGGSVNLGLNHTEEHYNPNNNDLIIIANNDIKIDFKLSELINRNLDFTESVFHVQVKNKLSNYIKSCGEIKLWFPFLQDYPMNFKEEFRKVDTLTGRFLMLKWLHIKAVGGIDNNLPHYGGDSDLGLKLKKININSYLLRDFSCTVNLDQTGVLNNARINQLIPLLTDIKSSFCLKYRWIFVRNHNNFLCSIFILIPIYIKLMFIVIKNHLR